MMSAVNPEVPTLSFPWLRLRTALWRFETLPLATKRFSALPPSSFVRRSLFGYDLFLDLQRSNAHRLLYLEGKRYIEERHVLRRLVDPGMTVVDVGANIGYYMLLLARLVGPTGHLVCLEPEPGNFSELSRNRAANALGNVRLLQAAAGAEDGTIGFMRGLNGTVADSGPGDLEARVLRLDSLTDVTPDLVKIDVEGYEGHVLAGASGLLRDRRPALFVELHPWLLYPPYSVDEIFTFLGRFYPAPRVFARSADESLAAKLLHRYLGAESIEELPNPLEALRPGGARHEESVWIVCLPDPG
jgi:FkbM family methyltransferase